MSKLDEFDDDVRKTEDGIVIGHWSEGVTVDKVGAYLTFDVRCDGGLIVAQGKCSIHWFLKMLEIDGTDYPLDR